MSGSEVVSGKSGSEGKATSCDDADCRRQGYCKHPNRVLDRVVTLTYSTPAADAPEADGRAEAFVRPSGKTYQPRKPGLVAHSWENHWGAEDRGCVIIGALDPDRTRALAVEMVGYWHGATNVDCPRPGWWRIVPRDGEREWTEDPVRGQPGVMWTAVYS